MTDDLAAFLRRMLDADEQEAEKLPDIDDYPLDPWAIQWEETGEWNSYGYLRIAKARALAEVEAKREQLDEHPNVNDGDCGTCVNGQWGYPNYGGSSPQPWPCRTLRLLALPYADRSDHREEWRP